MWAASFVGLLVGYILVSMWLTGDSFGESVGTFQAIVTAVAIAIAAAFAVFKLQIFRVFAPHLTITQRVSHRRIGESYVHIDVSTRLENSSKIKMELRSGFFHIQQIAPIADRDIEDLYSEVFIDNEAEDILWPVLDIVHRSWDGGVLIIEPGESHQEVCEFIVNARVESVLIYSYFFNPYSVTPRGWHSTTIRDIA